jgi:hypothetical protein
MKAKCHVQCRDIFRGSVPDAGIYYYKRLKNKDG